MEIRIKSIHLMLLKNWKLSLKRKCQNLEKSFEDITKVEVQLKVVKPATALNKETSLSVNVPGEAIYVAKTCDTFEEGIDQCVDALKVKLTKYKEKTRNK